VYPKNNAYTRLIALIATVGYYILYPFYVLKKN